MKRSSSLPSRLLWIVTVLASAMTMAAAPKSALKPNIILIVADDLGYGELGSYGQQKIQTPELDRMAREGMRFTRFYAGATVCAPSSSVLMTGQHQGRTRVRGNAPPENAAAQQLRATDITVATVLQAASYRTGLIGKWGLGLPGDEGIPNRQGFDFFFGYLSQTHAHNHFPDYLWRNEEKVTLPNVVVAVGTNGGGYATHRAEYAGDRFAAEARAFVQRHREEPFFLYLALLAPHANNERAQMLGDGQEVPDYGIYADRPWPAAMRGHAAMITRMDQQVGELLWSLQELGLDKKTLVLFTSDNGPHNEGGAEFDPNFFNPSGGLRGRKRDLYEGGIRAPLIARWPGKIKANVVSDHVSYFGDFMASFAELARTTPPPNLDSRSLVGVWTGRHRPSPPPFLYWEFHERGFKQACLMDGRWKAIRFAPGLESIELYDLKNDPAEQFDLAAKQPKRVRKAGAYLDQARSESADWPVRWRNPAPRTPKVSTHASRKGEAASRAMPTAIHET